MRSGGVWVQTKTAVEGEAMSKEGSRNIRSSGLRFWATVLQRFPEGMDYNQFWGPFLAAVEPQMERMAVEVGCQLWVFWSTNGKKHHAFVLGFEALGIDGCAHRVTASMAACFEMECMTCCSTFVLF